MVLDRAKGELRPAWWDESRYEMSAGGIPLVVGEARACEETEGPIKGLAYVLAGSVDAQRVDLLLDTGA